MTFTPATTTLTNMSWADIVEGDDRVYTKAKKAIQSFQTRQAKRCIVLNWTLNYIYSDEYGRSQKMVDARKLFVRKDDDEDQYDLSMILGKESKAKLQTTPKTTQKQTTPKTTQKQTTPKTTQKSQPQKQSHCKPCTPRVSNYRTQMCKHIKKCRQHDCNFAHSGYELVVSTCRFGNRCKSGDKCTWIHDGETKDDYCVRMRIW